MVESVVVLEAAVVSDYGTDPPDDTVEIIIEKKSEEKNGVEEVKMEEKMEKNGVEEVKMEEKMEKNGVQEVKMEKGEEEKDDKAAYVKMEEENNTKEEKESKVKEEAEAVKMEEDDASNEEKENVKSEEKAVESKVEKGSKKRGRGQKVSGKRVANKKVDDKKTQKVEEKKEEVDEKKSESESKEKEVDEEKAEKGEAMKNEEDEKKGKGLSSPVALSMDRPVRERKSVERLVESIEKENAKEFHIEKGQGTPLKDIPNVAFKLSKRKTDDIVRMLHMILFGRRGKAINFKSNICQFSGFVWQDNEDKQKNKMKEKLDKCVKDKLLELCDLLDIPIMKTTARKEDLVAKLLNFMEAPHATTDVLLAEKEQPNIRKRKRTARTSASKKSVSAPAEHSAKKPKTIEDTPKTKEKSSVVETEDEDEEKEDQENENDVTDRDEDEAPEHSGSDKEEDEDEDEDDKYSGKGKQGSKKSSNKGSAEKANSKKVMSPKKAPAAIPTKGPSKAPYYPSKANMTSNTSPKVFSRKKKGEDVAPKKSPTPSKANPKGKSGKTVAKGKERSKSKKESGPGAEELRKTICEILKEVDFNTATFTDILKQLARHFKKDLTPRKSAIKLMIQEELTKLAEEAEEDEDEDDNEGDGKMK